MNPAEGSSVVRRLYARRAYTNQGVDHLTIARRDHMGITLSPASGGFSDVARPLREVAAGSRRDLCGVCALVRVLARSAECVVRLNIG